MAKYTKNPMFKEALNYTFSISTPLIDGVDMAMIRTRYK